MYLYRVGKCCRSLKTQTVSLNIKDRILRTLIIEITHSDVLLQ